MLDDCSPIHAILAMVLHLFPRTPTLAQSILFRNSKPRVQLYADLPERLQLDQLGSASLIHMTDSGREYEITFQNRCERTFRLPDNFQHKGDKRSVEIMLRVFSSTRTLQIDDSGADFPDTWLDQWHGSTWSSLVSLNLSLFNIECQWVDPNYDDQWIADASQRISLPSLRKITVSSNAFDDYEEDWGAACAVLFDAFFYPADVTIAFENETGTDKQFRAAIDNAYRIRYGRGYFPAVDADVSDKDVDDVPLSEDETDNVPVSVFKPEKKSSES
ncbi:hypothetical protein BKA62DRAFT_317771 [Auriculariales sp. MPI-PUGE-AT-0066]|nr:hypothetical protein BKA62DRAFT_317771 [Auriculariales sp. MPI-PUGE-AT-0066]